MAPEVRDLQDNKSYDPKKADVYSLGVCLFILLFKMFPALKTDNTKLGDKLRNTGGDTLLVQNPFTVSQEKWERRSLNV
jgi:serine/threonine protein kinase